MSGHLCTWVQTVWAAPSYSGPIGTNSAAGSYIRESFSTILDCSAHFRSKVRLLDCFQGV